MLWKVSTTPAKNCTLLEAQGNKCWSEYLSLKVHVKVGIAEDMIVMSAGSLVWACLTLEPTFIRQNYWTWTTKSCCMWESWQELKGWVGKLQIFFQTIFIARGALWKNKTKQKLPNTCHFGLFFDILESIPAKKIPRPVSKYPVSHINPGCIEEQINCFTKGISF